jgi:YggT family protein
MFVLRQLLLAAAQIVDYALMLYMWIVVVRALVSWVNPDPWNPIVQFLRGVTDPVLRPIQRRLPVTGIDLSPVVLILAIMFLRWFLVPVLTEAAYRLS